MLSGYLKKEAKEWERTRQIVYMLYCVNTTDKKKISISEFMPLLTDKKEQKTAAASKEDIMIMSQQAMERAKFLQKK